MSDHLPEHDLTRTGDDPRARTAVVSRSRRARRTVISLAAFGVLAIVPTACDIGFSVPGSSNESLGSTGAVPEVGGEPSTVQTVPAAATQAYTEAGYGRGRGHGGGHNGGGNGGGGQVPPPVTEAPPVVDPPVEEPPVDEPPVEEPPVEGEQPPVDGEIPGEEVPGEEEPPAEEPPVTEEPPVEEPPVEEPPVEQPPANPTTPSGLEILGDDCTPSALEPHTGFQEAPRCVSVAFGEVAAAAQSPSLLITDAPQTVGVNEPFTLTISTRNLVRDRFLGAAVGGYYAESSFLNAEGIQRGHFHTACRLLPSLDEAPDAAPVPAFFLATQDNEGGEGVSFVDVNVANGIPAAGTVQCAVWAGDGSHRLPMMERANQTPAFDIVRITVE